MWSPFPGPGVNTFITENISLYKNLTSVHRIPEHTGSKRETDSIRVIRRVNQPTMSLTVSEELLEGGTPRLCHVTD